jgi:hypothetical protein
VSLFREYFLNVVQSHPDGGDWKPKYEYPGPLLPFRDPYDAAHAPYGAPWDNGRIGTVGTAYLQWWEWNHKPGFCFPEGRYAGADTRTWVVQIDRGGAIGQATFRWSDSWQSGYDKDVKVGKWNAEKVPIPVFKEGTRSPLTRLADGVEVWFATKGTPHFTANYTYHFRTYAAMNDVIWGDVKVPSEAKAGTYQGTLTVTAAGRPEVAVPIELEVWDFALPKERTVVTAFNGWMDDGFYAKAKGTDWLFELLLHEHRIDHQMIHGHRVEWEFKFEDTDWTAFDREAEKRLSGKGYPDGVPAKMFHLHFGFFQPGENKRSPEDTARAAKVVAAHLKEKGWFDRVYVYCKDEAAPGHFPAIQKDIQAYLKGDPDWAGKFMCVSNVDNTKQPGGDLVDIWCPKYHWYMSKEGWDAALRKKIWMYVANSPYSPYMTYHVDSIKGYEPRLIKWASWNLRAEGFLFWMACLDQNLPNPWTSAMNPFGATGDANLVYYGARTGAKCGDDATPLRPIDGPLACFRLKQIREGLEDWEYLNLAEKKVGRDQAKAFVKECYRGAGFGYGQKVAPQQLDAAWTQDDGAMYRTRARIAAAILGK